MITAAGVVDPLTETEFAWIRHFLLERTGIQLREGKESMVMGRLAQRLRHYGLTSFGAYLRRLAEPGAMEERRLAVDLLTTNETYFFREPRHFDILREVARGFRDPHRPLRVWSAASSSGEEAYSAAMVLADALPPTAWEIVGTDISTRVLHRARRGLYPIAAAEKIPQQYLTRYCLRGTQEYDGFMLIDSPLRRRVRFERANLIEDLPSLGQFDVVFLRNVMIYFGNDTKQDLIRRVERLMRPGGYLMIGHSETLNGITSQLRTYRPSVYIRGEGTA